MADQGSYWERAQSRRRVLQGVVLGSAGVAVATLAGCSSSKKSPPSPSAPAAQSSAATAAAAKQPKRGGTLIHAGGPAGSFDTRDTLDPYTVDVLGARGYHLMYQGLLGYHPRTLALEPELAQKWEQPDQATYVFHLQPGVKWHNKPPVNGRDFTADDVLYSFGRLQTDNPRFTSRSLLARVSKFEATDKATIKASLKEPDASMLTKFAGDSVVMMAKEAVEKAGDKFATADVVIGTGPFILKTLETDVKAEYVRNPDYWKPGRPYLDGFTNQSLGNDQLAYAAFQAGQIQVSTLPGVEVQGYISKQGQGYQPDWYREDSAAWITANVTTKPFDDARVARAMRLFTDHDEFKNSWVPTWHGRTGRHDSILPNALQDWDLSEDEYLKHAFWKSPKDEAVKEGLSLLSAAGFTKDKPLKFEIQGHTTDFLKAAAEMLQAQFRKFSQGAVDASLRVDDTAQAFTKRNQKQFQYYLGGWTGVMAFEPDSWLSEGQYTNGSQNFAGFSDTKLDGLIDAQRKIFDLNQRKAAVKNIVAYAMDVMPCASPSGRFFLNALNPKVRDFSPYFRLSSRQYEWIWLDA